MIRYADENRIEGMIRLSIVDIIKDILQLFSGIGIFLTACAVMSANLEALGSDKMQAMLSKAGGSRLFGVGIGALGTAIIQSSGATTVMTIGFVNAGVMSLSQAATIIYGANIGTTITGQIVALGMFGSGNMISTSIIFSSLAGVGAFIQTFSKNDRRKTIGGILTGFGMLFVGLTLVTGSMKGLSELESIKAFLAGIRNYFLLVFLGTALTAIVQSSAMITSLAITMLVSGLITLDQGIYITIGSNIGSCIAAILAGLSGNTNAKRASLIHLFFNIGGVILFMILGYLLELFSGRSLSFGLILGRLMPGIPQTQLAMFHTIFNITTLLLMLPLTEYLVGLVGKLIPEKKEAEQLVSVFHPRLYYIDENMLATPPIAVRQIKSEIVHMAGTAMNNFSLSLKIIRTQDYSDIEEFRNNETQLNFQNEELVRFMVKLTNSRLSAKDRSYLSTAFHSVTDLERVGDYAENIIEYADHLKANGDHFSDMAVQEINTLEKLVSDLYLYVVQTYVTGDADAFRKAKEIEEGIDDFTDGMAQNHIDRINRGICTANTGAQYLSLSSDAERIADHFFNVARAVAESQKL